MPRRTIFVVEAETTRPSDLAGRIAQQYVRILNVANNRESTEPGIRAQVERFMVAELTRLG